MSRNGTIPLATVLLCSLALSGAVLAATLSGYALPWQSVNSAGGRAESAAYALNATLGQTGAGQSANAAYQLGAGFWSGVGPRPTELPPAWGAWLPMILQANGD